MHSHTSASKLKPPKLGGWGSEQSTSQPLNSLKGQTGKEIKLKRIIITKWGYERSFNPLPPLDQGAEKQWQNKIYI